MRFVLGIFVGIAGFLAAGYFVATSGKISVAATNHGGINDKIDEWLGEVSDRSIETHAPRTTNPYANDPGALAVGLAHYKENCLDCHGARSLDGAEFSKGLNPAPPMLDMKGTQEMSDGELFWIVQNGIRMSGMPAFGATHKDREIWEIVAFLRHLPELTPEEEKALSAATKDAD